MSAPPVAVVLLSGGLDSCVATALAAREYRLAILHTRYGQRTEEREHRSFQNIAAHFGATQQLVVRVDFMRQIGGSSLLDPRWPNPVTATATASLPSTYVPFRNANLLGIAVAWAETLGARAIYSGIHQSDSQYPDCRSEFITAYNEVVRLGTGPDCTVEVVAPLLTMNKEKIIRLGMELKAPLGLTWSCYVREDVACGRCSSCLQRLEGFRAAGVRDPIAYL